MSALNTMRVHVGCQGWNYDDWITKPASETRAFYPQGTRAAAMLEIYARVFSSVEVDSTFYAVPSAATVDGWAKRTPHGFTFSLKLPQAITHERAFGSGSVSILEEFCDHARLLDEKLGVTLIQLPPHFTLTPENARALEKFLPQLPRDLRFSIEFRSPDWIHESVLKMLAKHNVALALVEGQWIAREIMWRVVEEPTADFAYVRWMGERNLTRFDIVQRPQNANLKTWSEAIRLLGERTQNVYAYFSNYYEGHAPASANKLKQLLGQSIVDSSELEDQPSLF
ncbi:MAG: DUF72 domain-containing protein [Pyrinomonadaceae bacterium]